MVLRAYEPDGEWEVTEEPCRNCGEPVWKAEVVGLNPDGVAPFGTAYKCPACNTGAPSWKPLEEFRGLIADWKPENGSDAQ